MAKLPIISGEKVIRAFLKLGYIKTRQRGSHIRLQHQEKKSLTIPLHKSIGKGLFRKLLRDAELSVDDFIKLL